MTSHVCPPDHSHDKSSNCYTVHLCRCTPCRELNTERQNRRRRLIAYGRNTSPFTDAAPVREHVLYLRANGIGAPRVAELAQVSPTVIRNMLYGRSRSKAKPRSGPSKRILAQHAAAILSIHPDVHTMSPGSPFPALGTRRRIQALVAAGWSLSTIGRHLGVSTQRVEQLATADMVAARSHLKIAALFEQLELLQPPHSTAAERIAYSRSINRARANRWAKPLDWDDIDNDTSPAAADDDDDIDDIAVELAVSGEHVRLNPAERREVVRALHPRKWSDSLIAEYAGCEDRTVLRIRQELGLEAWPQQDLVKRIAA